MSPTPTLNIYFEGPIFTISLTICKLFEFRESAPQKTSIIQNRLGIKQSLYRGVFFLISPRSRRRRVDCERTTPVKRKI
jgi:hypothetical protein